MKDAVIVLGGEINDDGSLPPKMKNRVEAGIRLLKEKQAGKIILAGSYSFWFDEIGKRPTFLEAEVMKRYCLEEGVSVEDILVETQSKDTVGNAYFTKVNILEPHNWRKLIVVSSISHIKRAKAIFDLVLGPNYEINYLGIDDGIVGQEKVEREAREERTIKALMDVLGDIVPGDNEKTKNFLFTVHPGYSKNPKISFGELRSILTGK